MKKILFICLFGFMPFLFLSAQDNENNGKTFIGINLGHTLAVSFVSSTLSNGTSYVPVHLIINHSLSEHFGLSGLLLFRSEKDGDNFLTTELGFAVGPSYLSSALNGFYIDCKFGLGIASGRDYDLNDYSRTDFIIQPDIGYYLNMGSKFTMIFGLGMQTLLKLSENPPRGSNWDWNGIGTMSHYYLPVLNISFGFKI